MMQTDLNRDDWPLEVQILGVNAIGSEAGNEAACEDNELPWLQDTPEEHVWDKWNVAYRDVVILDANNARVAVFNLTDNDLKYSWNYDALLAKLRSAAYSK